MSIIEKITNWDKYQIGHDKIYSQNEASHFMFAKRASCHFKCN